MSTLPLKFEGWKFEGEFNFSLFDICCKNCNHSCKRQVICQDFEYPHTCFFCEYSPFNAKDQCAAGVSMYDSFSPDKSCKKFKHTTKNPSLTATCLCPTKL